ncbi:hypothetical protein DUNSADRAFT_4195, partial [Dunaliella salina]
LCPHRANCSVLRCLVGESALSSILRVMPSLLKTASDSTIPLITLLHRAKHVSFSFRCTDHGTAIRLGPSCGPWHCNPSWSVMWIMALQSVLDRH